MRRATTGMTRIPELPYPPTMPAVVYRASSRFGDDDYIVMPDRRLSFRQLESASRRVAKELLAAGVTKATPVGIHLATGPEWAIVFTAVTRIGALAMPFSTLYRPPELRAAMRIGDVALLISSPRLLGKDHETFLEEAIPGLATSTPGRLRITELPYLRSIRMLAASGRPWAQALDAEREDREDPGPDIDDELLEAVESEVSPADSMVVVFTSGTTTDPKAVVHSHGALLRKTSPEANAALDAIFPGRVLTLMPFFWVGGMQQVLSALHSGATLLTLERLEAAAALDLGRREAATSIMGNPEALRSLLGEAGIEHEIPTIRPLPSRPWEGGANSKGDIPVGLGMTETFGPWAAVEGFECRVVDPESGAEVGEGEVGEFFVRGYGLMQGVYKREREEVFTPDGFYATGDLGYVENGLVFFKARLKEMIKTKGANVAPAEVEAILNAQPQVRLSFVVGLPHPEYGEEVVAGVVPEGDASVDVEALLGACRQMLSSYKVPTVIEAIQPDEVPYLSSSKPDRRGVMQLLAQRRGRR
jgi:acyl-CoA synthetase (AMP-forming)/AMP-acid ligase II